jgi:hypothetical protein
MGCERFTGFVVPLNQLVEFVVVNPSLPPGKKYHQSATISWRDRCCHSLSLFLERLFRDQNAARMHML